MGFLDFLKKGGIGDNKCAQCKKETELPFSKKFGKESVKFCSKECSRQYRIARKKRAKKPMDTGRSLPW